MHFGNQIVKENALNQRFQATVGYAPFACRSAPQARSADGTIAASCSPINVDGAVASNRNTWNEMTFPRIVIPLWLSV